MGIIMLGGEISRMTRYFRILPPFPTNVGGRHKRRHVRKLYNFFCGQYKTINFFFVFTSIQNVDCAVVPIKENVILFSVNWSSAG